MADDGQPGREWFSRRLLTATQLGGNHVDARLTRPVVFAYVIYTRTQLGLVAIHAARMTSESLRPTLLKRRTRDERVDLVIFSKDSSFNDRAIV